MNDLEIDQKKPIPPLNYTDFISRPRAGELAQSVDRLPTLLFRCLLKPGTMPIHPDLFNKPEFYTERFVDKIFRSMPDSLGSDISAISKVLGVDLEIVEQDGTFKILNQGVNVCSIGQNELKRSKFETGYDYGSKHIGYDYSASKLVAGVTDEGEPHYTQIVPYPPEELSEIARILYPLNRETINAYKYKDVENGRAAELIVWHTHNTDYLSRLLIIRSFAVLFNNLGLEELGLI